MKDKMNEFLYFESLMVIWYKLLWLYDLVFSITIFKQIRPSWIGLVGPFRLWRKRYRQTYWTCWLVHQTLISRKLYAEKIDIVKFYFNWTKKLKIPKFHFNPEVETNAGCPSGIKPHHWPTHLSFTWILWRPALRTQVSELAVSWYNGTARIVGALVNVLRFAIIWSSRPEFSQTATIASTCISGESKLQCIYCNS